MGYERVLVTRNIELLRLYCWSVMCQNVHTKLWPLHQSCYSYIFMTKGSKSILETVYRRAILR